jgi:hypothetical protein
LKSPINKIFPGKKYSWVEEVAKVEISKKSKHYEHLKIYGIAIKIISIHRLFSRILFYLHKKLFSIPEMYAVYCDYSSFG